MKQQIKTPLWKAFWLWVLPLLLAYQLLWGLVFNLPLEGGDYAFYSQLILIKLIIELLIYLFLPLYFYRATATCGRYSHHVTGLFFAILFGLTFEAILVRFIL
ncbi:hypothetical protein swp_4125 [Shewanella piezotolerans WP3]|uniref:Uncharacterized protein n=1 Tax=Shewanella piezotolerans (strain WP3 / JCM 13877) TaxID=225849 RepID=B8CT12_SHEPW|nr:hypothetical protein [Shewanella piezotolerans]ACJ30788.1 hypothetical protein swp_4125 [Shewanella piezotolerans WP3]